MTNTTAERQNPVTKNPPLAHTPKPLIADRSAVLPVRARLSVNRFRFLCRLSRLAAKHPAYALFDGQGGALIPAGKQGGG